MIPLHQMDDSTVYYLLYVVHSLSLSAWLQLEDSARTQDVTATILAFFCALPSPFMPPQILQTCQTSLPSKSAASQILGEAMSPVEWAIFRHMTGVTWCALQGHCLSQQAHCDHILPPRFRWAHRRHTWIGGALSPPLQSACRLILTKPFPLVLLRSSMTGSRWNETFS